MTTPPNIHRLWRLSRGDDDCVGAIAEGRVPGMIDEPPPEPFVAVVSFARLGPPSRTILIDGQVHVARPVLEDEEPQPKRGWRCATIEIAVSWLAEQKRQLLAEGWVEIGIDPVNDPD